MRVASFPGSSAWAEKKEPGAHCLRMLSSPRISGKLKISVIINLLHYTNLRKVCRLLPYKRCLLLTTLCVDDDEGTLRLHELSTCLCISVPDLANSITESFTRNSLLKHPNYDPVVF